MNTINKTHVLMHVVIKTTKDGDKVIRESNVIRAYALSTKSGKPCAITSGDGKYYTFEVINTGNYYLTVKLERVA